MADKLVIQTAVDASGVVAGVDQTVTGLQRIGAAQEQVAAEAQKLSGSQAEAAQVAQAYSVSLQTAERALTILGAAAGQAMNDVAALDAAMDEAQAETAQAAASTRAYIEEMKASAAAMSETTAAEEKQSQMSEALAGALQRVGIAESEVAEMATKMGISLEVAGRAMFLIKQSEMATAVAAARMEIEAMTPPTLEAAAAQTALGDASAKAGNTGAMAFGRGSPFFHAMVGASNISRGGTMALRGFFEEIELASFLLPGAIGPLLLLAATVGTIADRMANAKKPTDDLKDSTGDLGEKMGAAGDRAGHLKDKLEPLATSIKNAGDAAKAAVTDMAESETAEFNAFKEIETAEKSRTAEITKQLELRQKITQAELEGARAKELAANQGGAAGVQDINEKYDDLELQSKAQTDQQKFQAEASSLYRRIAIATDAGARAQLSAASWKSQYLDLQKRRRQALFDAHAAGLTGSTPKDFEEQASTLQEKMYPIGTALDAVQHASTEAATPAGAALDTEQKKGMREYLTRLYKSNLDRLSGLMYGAKRTANVLSVTDSATSAVMLQEAEKSQHEEDDQTDKVTDLKSQLADLLLARTAANLEADNDKSALGKKHIEGETAVSDQDFEGHNKAAILRQQAIIDDKTASPSGREAAEKEIARLKNEADQRKIDERGGMGLFRATGPIGKPLTPGDLDEADAEQTQNTAQGNAKAATINTAQDRVQGRADAKDVAERLREARGEIEASGNKEAIQEMHRIMELVLDKNVQIAQLQLLANATLSAKHDALTGVVHELQRQVTGLSRKTDSLINSQGASN